MRKILLAVAIALGLLLTWLAPAAAQSNNILIVSSCGNQSFTASLTNLGILTEDTTGKLCTNTTSNQGTAAALSGAWPVNIGMAAGGATDGWSTNSIGFPFAPSGGSVIPSVASYMFNGTTWDRARGSAAAGMQVSPNSYPFNSTEVTGNSGVVANAAATATLGGAVSKTTYLAGFQITAAGATAAGCVTATVSNINGATGGSLSYVFCAPAGATTGAQPLTVNFTPPIPANGQNIGIVVSLPALGAGNTAASVNAWGFQQ